MPIKLYRPVTGERNVARRMTQAFGLRPEVYGPMGFKGHMGLDYAGPKPGDKIKIYSASEGTVTTGRDPKGYGNFVKVVSNFDGKDYTVLYGHLDSITCKNGPIKCMEQIGIMGTTGFSSGVHLHFEIKDATQMGNGYKGRIDPAPYISDRETIPPTPPVVTPPVTIPLESESARIIGIRNGERPKDLVTREECAIMCFRASQK